MDWPELLILRRWYFSADFGIFDSFWPVEQFFGPLLGLLILSADKHKPKLFSLVVEKELFADFASDEKFC